MKFSKIEWGLQPPPVPYWLHPCGLCNGCPYNLSKMDHQPGHGQPPITGSQVPYGVTQYQSPPTAGLSSPSSQMAHHQLAYQHMHQQQQQQLQQQLQGFWAEQQQDIEQTNEFKNHSLPLARIKKIMKADEDVRMISAEAPVVFARACEMFILELTLRSWNHTEENKRRTLQKNDIAAAITRTDIFDFLVDIVPREDLKDEVLGSIPRGTVPVGAPTEGIPYYYMQPQHAQGLYGQQPLPYGAAQPMWPHQQQPPADS